MTQRAKYFYGPIMAVAIIGLWIELIGFVLGAGRVIAVGCIFFGAGLLTVVGVGNFILDYVINQKTE